MKQNVEIVSAAWHRSSIEHSVEHEGTRAEEDCILLWQLEAMIRLDDLIAIIDGICRVDSWRLYFMFLFTMKNHILILA